MRPDKLSPSRPKGIPGKRRRRIILHSSEDETRDSCSRQDKVITHSGSVPEETCAGSSQTSKIKIKRLRRLRNRMINGPSTSGNRKREQTRNPPAKEELSVTSPGNKKVKDAVVTATMQRPDTLKADVLPSQSPESQPEGNSSPAMKEQSPKPSQTGNSVREVMTSTRSSEDGPGLVEDTGSEIIISMSYEQEQAWDSDIDSISSSTSTPDYKQGRHEDVSEEQGEQISVEQVERAINQEYQQMQLQKPGMDKVSAHILSDSRMEKWPKGDIKCKVDYKPDWGLQQWLSALRAEMIRIILRENTSI